MRTIRFRQSGQAEDRGKRGGSNREALDGYTYHGLVLVMLWRVWVASTRSRSVPAGSSAGKVLHAFSRSLEKSMASDLVLSVTQDPTGCDDDLAGLVSARVTHIDAIEYTHASSAKRRNGGRPIGDRSAAVVPPVQFTQCLVNFVEAKKNFHKLPFKFKWGVYMYPLAPSMLLVLVGFKGKARTEL